jgi:hypothetical protein
MAIGAVAIIGSIAGLACRDSDESRQAADVETGQQAEFADIKQACDVFTLDMARQLLGESAKQSEISAPFAGSTDDIAGSTCTYEAEDPTPRNQFVTTITASILLNGAKTDIGKSSNRFTFEQGKSEVEQAGEQTETVIGLGDAAYYIGGITNQLQVLVEDGKYVLIVSAMDPDGNNQVVTERLARWVTEKL